MKHGNLLWTWVALALGACTGAVDPADAGDAATDAGTAADTLAADTGETDTSSFDASDTAPEVDVQIRDVAPDTGSSIEGRWRILSYDVTGATGERLHFTDVNVPMMFGTMSFHTRVNGSMFLTADRLALTFGILIQDHMFLTQTSPRPDAWSASGFSAPGTLDRQTFTIAGSPNSFAFASNPDGTISLTNAGGGTTTLGRWPTVRTNAAILATGSAAMFHPGMSQPFMNPRVALAWDRALGPGQTFTNDRPLTFMSGFAGFGINVTAANLPAEAIGTIAGTQVAIAFTIVYDDVDGNNRYDAPGTPVDGGTGGDVLRGISPIAITFRSDGEPSGAFLSSPFRDSAAGFQFAHAHQDFSISRVGVTPFDSTLPVSPDIVVETGAVTIAIPDVIP